MIRNRKLELGLTLMCSLFSSSISAQAAPHVSLFSYSGNQTVTHPRNDPLLLTVSIENSDAIEAQRLNKRNAVWLKRFSESAAYSELSVDQIKELTADYQVREIPVLSLGSKSSPPVSLIDIRVVDDRGDQVDSSVRPLESSRRAENSIELTISRSHYFRFIIEPQDLSLLKDGRYSFVAVVKSAGDANGWEGDVSSKVMTVTLSDTHENQDWESSNQRSMLLSIFLLGDEQFQQAETHARDWIKRHPDSVDATTQLGEALLAQNKEAEALAAFSEAESKFRSKHGNQPRELPHLIVDRINELREILGNPVVPEDPPFQDRDKKD